MRIRVEPRLRVGVCRAEQYHYRDLCHTGCCFTRHAGCRGFEPHAHAVPKADHAGMFFFYSKIGLAYSHLGVVLAHAAIGTPYVVITVTATLVGFDETLIRASGSLGAKPLRTFFKVIMPLITPGVVSGALFAFITSFDEVVLIYFIADAGQKTIPIQMWSGLRQQISPSILAVATMLVAFSIVLLIAIELLRRRSERLRTTLPS